LALSTPPYCLVIGTVSSSRMFPWSATLTLKASHLKDRAYKSSTMGINVGAFLAPVVAEFMKNRFGFHPALPVAVVGMAFFDFISGNGRSI